VSKTAFQGRNHGQELQKIFSGYFCPSPKKWPPGSLDMVYWQICLDSTRWHICHLGDL